MKIRGKNVLESYLALLGVRYSSIWKEHPYKFSLYGISKMLFDYGVDNGATQIPDKEQNISEIGIPFIAQFGGDFVAVYKVEPEQVSFIWKGVNHNINYTNLGLSLLLVVYIAGWLLLLKQMRIHSQYADKICSLFKQKDCNNILESKAAKLFGTISLSEIGFGYFSTNLLLLLLFPTSHPAIALLNILTLPFTLWSVWYQGAKARVILLFSIYYDFFIKKTCYHPYFQDI